MDERLQNPGNSSGGQMAGYCGTEVQRRLQAQAEANVGFINSTAGACQTGRMMGCDDLNAFGWERIDGF